MTSISLSGPGADHEADADEQPSTIRAAQADAAPSGQPVSRSAGQPVNSDRQPQFDVADNATIRSAIAERTIAINALTVRFYANPVRRPATVDARWTIRVNQIRTRRL